METLEDLVKALGIEGEDGRASIDIHIRRLASLAYRLAYDRILLGTAWRWLNRE